MFASALLLQYFLVASLLQFALAVPHGHNKPCTPETAAVRREWGSLTKSERKDFIDAVLCLQSKPSIIPDGLVPGAKTRFDDFTATHINNTRRVHNNGVFLSWHRNFVWLREKALREECGYKGWHPYWNWALWCEDLAGSPLFDGSDTSLSGDGVYDNSSGPYPYVFPGGSLPHGTGGGCVYDGPFKDMVSNLGPIDFQAAFTGLPANWTVHNPHCLIRDLNNYISTRYGNQTAIDILMSQPDIANFQITLSGPADINLGPHGGGHFSLGPALIDFFASPADPAFFVHHSMVDRVWTLWQAMDPESRTFALNGTSTIFDGGDTPPVTLDTMQSWDYLGEPKSTGELMSVMDGDFCYRYE